MHRDRHLEISQACWAKNKDKYNLDRKRGGATLFGELLIKQNDVCAICFQPEKSNRYKTLSVDHDHETGKIRGLLCSHCNRALGLFSDNLINIESALKYLKEHNE